MCKLKGRSKDGIDTLIFLDVDGVLNVAPKDPGQNPPTFNARNISHALNMCRAGPTRQLIAEKLLILHDTYRDTDGGTYGQLMSRSDQDVSDVLVGRFVQIVAAAGPRGKVVLCSSWRKPEHVERVRQLEALVSEHMGCTFAFHDRTATDGEDTCGAQRLVFIGDFVEKYCSANRPSQVRVVVLEDFLISQVRGWLCGKTEVNSVSDAERYLESRGLAHAPGDEHPCAAQNVNAKVLHTYQEWTAPACAYHSKPMQMVVGVGLGVEHVSRALHFLGKPAAKEPDTYVDDMVEEPLTPENADEGGFCGKVLSMFSEYGWISPISDIDHPDAYKYGGRIYFSYDDVLGQVNVGDVVRFNVYTDDQGLGADHVKLGEWLHPEQHAYEQPQLLRKQWAQHDPGQKQAADLKVPAETALKVSEAEAVPSPVAVVDVAPQGDIAAAPATDIPEASAAPMDEPSTVKSVVDVVDTGSTVFTAMDNPWRSFSDQESLTHCGDDDDKWEQSTDDEEWTAPACAYHSQMMQIIAGMELDVEHVSRALDFLEKPIAKEPDTDVVDMLEEPLTPEKAATHAPEAARFYDSGKVDYVPLTGLATVNEGIMECLGTDCSEEEFWSMVELTERARTSELLCTLYRAT